MKGIAKTAAYIAAAAAVLIFGFLFFHQRALLAHAGTPLAGSKLQMFTYLGFLGFFAVILIVLSSFDLKDFFGKQVERIMVQSAPPTDSVPELEEAQRLRASGEPLDAIRILREYLQANPYHLHVMSRIAEVYRYDLGNDLAAALEYEELLKHKLPDDQWAWAALHLAKLYGRLNELEKSVALLDRLDSKFGHTIAGRRAKKALHQVRNPDEQTAGEDGPEQDSG
jgi:hypothetical protein